MIYLYWLLPVPVLVLIVILMYRRKQHRSYPIFWGFLLFQCPRLVAEAFFFRFSWKAYFYTYWITSACDAILALLLLRGIFHTVLHLYSSTKRFRTAVFEIALACFWCVGVVIACQSGNAHTIMQVITRVGQAVSIAEVGMFIFVVISSTILGVTWSEALCGIAAGLGLLGSVDLFCYAAFNQGRITRKTLSYLETAAYFLAVAIFAFYFVPRRAERSVEAAETPELLEWAKSMRRTVSR